jgi:hypothetical protein
MTPAEWGGSPEKMPTVIPVLSTVVPDSEIPAAVLAELDSKALEKAQFMALTEGLVQELRPELERLATELVRRSLGQVWTARSKLDLD